MRTLVVMGLVMAVALTSVKASALEEGRLYAFESGDHLEWNINRTMYLVLAVDEDGATVRIDGDWYPRDNPYRFQGRQSQTTAVRIERTTTVDIDVLEGGGRALLARTDLAADFNFTRPRNLSVGGDLALDECVAYKYYFGRQQNDTRVVAEGVGVMWTVFDERLHATGQGEGGLDHRASDRSRPGDFVVQGCAMSATPYRIDTFEVLEDLPTWEPTNVTSAPSWVLTGVAMLLWVKARRVFGVRP